MTNPEEKGPPVFGGDIEKYLRDSATSVKAFEMLDGRDDPASAWIVKTGHVMAHGIANHIKPEDRALAHRALVIASGMISGLIVGGVYNPVAIANVMAVAAEHLVEIEKEEGRHEG